MSEELSNKSKSYTVVARRYRPRTFTELIGQEHIAQALSKAIASGRVGHAYLFTGARGVGKTSTARIFAKALNASAENETLVKDDIATAIESGDDMDVIEIDGASNRGIEEIRQLRANVTVRPSRARYKIYIIDEVHMLTNQAFNALLKTLEEPPEHVKFIFCTTDPDKLPITVLSRCQRFDFVPVKFEAIQQRLKEISLAEGYEAEDEALALLARKAAGSMRDSQSLLEQVMSFSTERITADQVHALLGTADEGRLLELVEALRARAPLAALAVVEDATRGGSDPGQLAEQLLNYLRDLMAVGIGGGPELLKLANPAGHARLSEIAGDWGVQTILSAIQILDESLVRMRSSVSSTTLLEVALVQICQLQDLAMIPAMIDAVLRGGPLPTSIAQRPMTGSLPAPQKSIAAETASPRPTASKPEVSKPASPPASSPAKPNAPADEKKNGNSQVELTDSIDASDSSEAPDALGAVAQLGSPDLSSVEVDPSAVEDVSAQSAALQTAVTNVTQSVVSAVTLSSSPAELATASATSIVASIISRPSANSISTSSPTGAARTTPGSPAALEDWKRCVASVEGMLADFAGMAQSVDPQGSDQWTIYFPPGSQKTKEYCEVADRKSALLAAVERTMGRSIRLNFVVPPGPPLKTVEPVPAANQRAQRQRELAEHPMIKKICDLLGGEIVRVDAAAPPQVATPIVRPLQTAEHA